MKHTCENRLCRILGETGACFVVGMTMTGCFYLIDCLLSVMFGMHPELPFYERGIFAGGPAGFLATIFMFCSTIYCTLKSACGYPPCTPSAEKKAAASSTDAPKDSQEKSPASSPMEKRAA
jgi:hypothetical protein